ncbi:MAG: uracil-DNA glycosylase family protein [Myxococcaceae bacterium]
MVSGKNLSEAVRQRELVKLHHELDACRACPGMIGPVVHGPPLLSRIFLVGQAPGPREGSFGKPFAWTAGKTMFRWFEDALGIDEESFRQNIYMAAVARCFPGKAKGGGDRKPDPKEIHACRSFLEREVRILKPELVIPVGTLAIAQVLDHEGPLVEIVGKKLRVDYHGVKMDAIALPHPSGASTWHRAEPGKSLLQKALKLIGEHPVVGETFRH